MTQKSSHQHYIFEWTGKWEMYTWTIGILHIICLCYCMRSTKFVLAVQLGWIGWDAKVMNLIKSSQRGLLFIKLNPVHKILFGQWNDNKVVSFISRLGIYEVTSIKWGIGANIVNIPVHSMLQCYASNNFMSGVNNMDMNKKIGGSFTAWAMFRKWYRMGLMGVFHFMLVNGQQA